MDFLRGSLNYTWSTGNVLGRGSTSMVYKGIHKSTGENVAVKCFHERTRKDIKMRELTALQKVNHENIVKLLAIEDDQQGYGQVMVMELCTGGSLLSILDEPENSCGLPQTEFLLILKHLSAGMKHLRDNKLIHRDLKPGNIMKFITEDGQTIYKIGDFGASREIEDHQLFASFYGTEQYLHPEMYEFAFFPGFNDRHFAANVDLWSIGVTLYHAATGDLPFRPFGLRDRKTMHELTTKKASGVISGIQLSENGAIEWSTTFPTHCQLSKGLKQLVTPLIAGLLESDREKMWTFDKFFEEVTIILRKRVIHVFSMSRCSSIEIFLEPEEQIEQLREQIFLQTKVQAPILLFNNNYFEKILKMSKNAKNFPITSLQTPIFLYDSVDGNIRFPKQIDLPEFPEFSNNISIESDANMAKTICSIGHDFKRRIDVLTSIDTFLKTGVEQFIEALNAAIILLFNKTQLIDALLNIVMTFGDALEVMAKMTNQESLIEETMTSLKNMKTEWTNGVFEANLQIHKHLVDEDKLREHWLLLVQNKDCPNIKNASAQAQIIVQQFQDSWKYLEQNRAQRNLTFKEEQFHSLEKTKILRYSERIKSILCDNAGPATLQMAKSFVNWYDLALTIYSKIQNLEKIVNDSEQKINTIRDELSQLKEEFKKSTKINNIQDQSTANRFKYILRTYLHLMEREKIDVMAQVREMREITELMEVQMQSMP